MAEALFYHLTSRTLEQALPELLEKTLERGWRALVKCGTEQRVEALDLLLWTYEDFSFLPHGTKHSDDPSRQPIFLTDSDNAPNEAEVLFLVDMADTEDFTAHERTAVIFQDSDTAAKELAREQWLRASEMVDATYWKQSAEGRWIKELEKKK